MYITLTVPAPTSSLSNTATSTTSSVTSTSSATPNVPGCLSVGDGQTSSTSDGSQYVAICTQDNLGSQICGISPKCTSFASCLETCSEQGTICTGVTWQVSTLQCTLKQQMLPVSPGEGSTTGVDSAVRLSGPGGFSSTPQLLTNGDFSQSLSSWSTCSGPPYCTVSVVNGSV